MAPTTLHRLPVHPELAPVLAALPERPHHLDDVEAARAGFEAMVDAIRPADDGRLAIERAVVPGPDGNEVPVEVLRPRGAAGPLPGVLYVHGGGFAYGELATPSPWARAVCEGAGAVVVNVNYRLAPEHPFPAGVEDCDAALRWMADHAGRLGVDAARVAVTGASAGACLSAALALMARDRGGPAIAHQCLLVPVLDDRVDTASARRVTDRRIVNGPGVRRTWEGYLGAGRAGGADVSPYAAPARAADLSGLPPAYVLVCGLDPLRDEGLAYARRLAEAGVDVELRHVAGAWHFFEAYAPETEVARRTTAHWIAAMREALRVPAGMAVAAGLG
jgi:acetyl esterase/lipase